MSRLCRHCEHVDYSALYGTDPPEYKCDLYGCLVRADGVCISERGTDGVQGEGDTGGAQDAGH